MNQIPLRHLPNIITSIRFILILPILWTLLKKIYLLSFCLFLIAGISDGLDGLLARIFGWTSDLGAFLDPLADKLLLMGSFIVLAYLQQIPFALMLFIIGRDIWIMSGALMYRYWVGPLKYKPIWISKFNTFLQLILVTLLLIKLTFFELSNQFINKMVFIVFVTTLLSFIQYTWVWAKQASQYFKLSIKKQTR